MVYIRFSLTALLLYGVYTETGIWTALLLFLIVTAIEVRSHKGLRWGG